MRGIAALLSVALATGCAGRHDARAAMRFGPHRASSRAPIERERILAALPQIDEMAEMAFREERMPSLVAAVLLDGQLVFWRGMGARAMGAADAVNAQTVYRIGSVTKVVTAMALLRLRDEQRLSLEQAASDFLPELDQVLYPTPDSPVITLRHLVTHTSGLPRLGRFDYAAPRRAPVAEREVLDSLRGTRLLTAPGTAWLYSNFAYALLGIAIGRISGMPYRDYVSQTIFAPLGMRAVWDFGAVSPEHRASGYERIGDRYQPTHEWLLGEAEAMGGLYASLDDMVRFVGFAMTAWPAGARPDAEPLNNASLREAHMLGGFQPPSHKGTGMGWGVVEFPGVGHGVFHTGATASYAATAMFLPRHGVGFVAMTNCGQLADAIDRLGGRTLVALARAAKGE
jgi:CubicO group peptidase (beta-lactamase class C family)